MPRTQADATTDSIPATLEATFETKRTVLGTGLPVGGLTREAKNLATILGFAEGLALERSVAARARRTVEGIEGSVESEHALPDVGTLLRGLGHPVSLVRAIAAVARQLAGSDPSPSVATRREFRWVVERLADRIEIRRLQYESPLEIALLLPPAIIASKVGLSIVIFAIRRMYGMDLELRTYREDLRAEYYAAKRHAEEARRAWEAGRDPEHWPAGMLEEFSQLIKRRPPSGVAGLAPDKIVLVDDEPEEGP